MKVGDKVRTPKGEGVIARQASGGWFVTIGGEEHYFAQPRVHSISQAIDEAMPPVETDRSSPRRRKD